MVVEAARLAAWTAPLKPAAGAAAAGPGGVIAASPPVSVPPPRRGWRDGAHVPAPCVPPAALPSGLSAVAPSRARPQGRVQAEVVSHREALDDAWVHVEMPAAAVAADLIAGPAIAAAAAAVQQGESGRALTPPAVSSDLAPSINSAAAAAAVAAPSLRPAMTASGELLFDFDGGSLAASPSRPGAAMLTAASADEVRSHWALGQ